MPNYFLNKINMIKRETQGDKNTFLKKKYITHHLRKRIVSPILFSKQQTRRKLFFFILI